MKRRIIILAIIASLITGIYLYFPKQTDPIAVDKLRGLEMVAEFFKKKNIWHVKIDNGRYIFTDNNEKEVDSSEGRNLVPYLLNGNISYIYSDSNGNIYFDILNSDKIYVFSSEGINVKIGELIWVGKVDKIINANWITLNECTRTNCPELDK